MQRFGSSRSRHRRQKGGTKYLLGLVLLMFLTIWVLQWDLEQTSFFKWIESEQTNLVSRDTTIYKSGQTIYYSTKYHHSIWVSGFLDSSMTWVDDLQADSITSLCLNDSSKQLWLELQEQSKLWQSEFGVLQYVVGVLDIEDKVKNEDSPGSHCPNRTFAAFLIEDGADSKALGFIFPNSYSSLPLHAFVVSIDEVENESGLNLFSDQLPDSLEIRVENRSELLKWGYNLDLYDQRIKSEHVKEE